MKLQAYIDGIRRKDVERLTPAMRQMLFDTRDHGDMTHSLRGRSAFGGASRTHATLKRLGLMDGDKLTDAGRVACSAEWREEQPSPSMNSHTKNEQRLLDAAREVLASWEAGNLAPAVRNLDSAVKAFPGAKTASRQTAINDVLLPKIRSPQPSRRPTG
ncbi:hypothetical protein OPIT5_00435 (plasmid) [Opitutaceae bacterium TAV5]|nr:hypothetical protein OPIT5_00435 [Opitutaceae bacterium TAV5]